MKTRWLACAAVVTMGCGPSRAAAPVCADGHATVILVRHAEKASNDADAELSDKGQARAQRLATLLAKTGATELLATDVKRTQQTLAPLAQAIGKPVSVRKARETDALVEELRHAKDGAVVVVAHHSNGIPKIARALGVTPHGLAPKDDVLPETEFDRVIVVSLGCDRARATSVELSSD